MFFDPAYAYAYGSMPFRRKKKKKYVVQGNDEMDIFQKFMMFQEWLDRLDEKKKSKEPKKDDKKPDKKPDFVGLSMFLMVISFFGGQASLLYLYQLFSAIPK